MDSATKAVTDAICARSLVAFKWGQPWYLFVVFRFAWLCLLVVDLLVFDLLVGWLVCLLVKSSRSICSVVLPTVDVLYVYCLLRRKKDDTSDSEMTHMWLWHILHEWWHIDSQRIKYDIPPKFNIASERWWLEDYFPIGSRSLFRGELLNFGRVYLYRSSNEMMWRDFVLPSPRRPPPGMVGNSWNPQIALPPIKRRK